MSKLPVESLSGDLLTPSGDGLGGIGLEADGVESSDLSEPGLQFFNQLAIALGIVLRTERVQAADRGPTEGLHFHRCIEFHGAGPQRNHRRGQ